MGIALVRRRRWARNRTRAADMTRAIVGQLSDGAIEQLGVEELHLVLAKVFEERSFRAVQDAPIEAAPVERRARGVEVLRGAATRV